jgi:hypothetical protein
MLKIVLLDKIFAYNTGTCSPEKIGKKFKKSTYGVLKVSKWTSNFSKKNHVAHSTPGGSPIKKNKSAIRPRYYLRGLPVFSLKRVFFLCFYASLKYSFICEFSTNQSLIPAAIIKVRLWCSG